MKTSSSERRKRLNDLCKGLFDEYKKRFHLYVPTLIRRPEDINDALFEEKDMEPGNIVIEFYSQDEKELATWKNGNMTYQEAFFK